MMHSAAVQYDMSSIVSKNDPSKRNINSVLNLVEIDRANVVDSIRLGNDYEPDGVYAAGTMRELCPKCHSNHLKLVLRQKRVRHAHLFCECCDQCFDAHYLDGSPALEIND